MFDTSDLCNGRLKEGVWELRQCFRQVIERAEMKQPRRTKEVPAGDGWFTFISDALSDKRAPIE